MDLPARFIRLIESLESLSGPKIEASRGLARWVCHPQWTRLPLARRSFCIIDPY